MPETKTKAEIGLFSANYSRHLPKRIVLSPPASSRSGFVPATATRLHLLLEGDQWIPQVSLASLLLPRGS
jgi:hypothetical protein